MSRSFKKPYIKDKGTYMKQVSARGFRHRCRQISKKYRKELSPDPYWFMWYYDVWIEDPAYPLRRELVNEWDVCDWRCFQPDDPKYFRK